MRIIETTIPDVLIIKPEVFSDSRGFFMESYQSLRYTQIGIPNEFVQDNFSKSKQGVLRGLHYQVRQTQGKLIWVMNGEIFDVIVDLRRRSPTFGKWVGTRLSAETRMQIWAPPGFAHGYYVLSKWADVVYKTTDFYAPNWECTLLWNDPEIGIQWPLIDGDSPILSEKDAQGNLFHEIEYFD